jgi:two-component system, OmpR family, response regulator MprA
MNLPPAGRHQRQYVRMVGRSGELILVAEDDSATRRAVTLALELEGYRVTAVADGASALDAVEAAPPAAIVLDRMMPVMDGLAVCRLLRSRDDRTPVLVLTARSEVTDRVAGLDAGADDYLTKPFALDELLARLRALLRRTGYEQQRKIQVADLVVDEAARLAHRGERRLDLTKTEFDLLCLLARNAGIVLSQSTIYDRIWGYDFGPDSKNLSIYIGYLRRKLEEDGEPRLIQTVRGVGYTVRAA